MPLSGLIRTPSDGAAPFEFVGSEGGVTTLRESGGTVRYQITVVAEGAIDTVVVQVGDALNLTITDALDVYVTIEFDPGQREVNIEVGSGRFYFALGALGLGAGSAYDRVVITNTAGGFSAMYYGPEIFVYDSRNPPRLPPADIFAEPRAQLCVNLSWASWVMGEIARLERSSVWDTTPAEVHEIVNQVRRLQGAIGGASDNPCAPPVLIESADFVTGEQGWSLGGFGVYAPGVGFEATFDQWYRVGISRSISPQLIRRVEIDFSYTNPANANRNLVRVRLESETIEVNDRTIADGDQTGAFLFDQVASSITLQVEGGRNGDSSAVASIVIRGVRIYG